MAGTMIDTEQLPRMSFYLSGVMVISGAFTVFSSELFPYVLQSWFHTLGILLGLGLVYFNMIRVISRRYMRRLNGTSRMPWLFSVVIGGLPLFWIGIYDTAWPLSYHLLYVGIIILFSALGAWLGHRSGLHAQVDFQKQLSQYLERLEQQASEKNNRSS